MRDAADAVAPVSTDMAASGNLPQMESDVRQLYECIRRLPDLDKTLVSLFLEDASSKEIAEVTGMSEANVRVRLHRIKKTLKQLWEESGYGIE